MDTIFKSFFKNRKLCMIGQFDGAEIVQKNASKTEKAARTKKVRAAALGSTCYNTGCNGAFAPCDQHQQNGPSKHKAHQAT